MPLDRVVEGDVALLKEVFLDEYDIPVELVNTEPGPKVRLLDSDRNILSEVYALPSVADDPGTWAANLPIPLMDLRESTEFLVIWEMRSSEGDTYKSRQTIVVEPDAEHRISDIVVVKDVDVDFEIVLPHVYNETSGDTLTFSLMYNNEARYTNPLTANDIQNVHVGVDQTVCTLNLGGFPDPTLQSMILFVTYKKLGQTAVRYEYKVWHVTPQIILASGLLEDWINKAKVDNVIPELDYTQSDLVMYLQRGLALFNSYGPQITNFTGTNMQGPLLDSWLVMSTYYALGAQLQAEGALAFDFSGQTVNLNIDRTPSIEAALGRIESQMENSVKPLKKLLAKNGILSGSGAAGGTGLNNSRGLGSLQILNAPTSKFGYVNRPYGSRYRGR